MNLAAQIAAYTDKGFTGEQAEVIVLMRVASGVLFREVPRILLAIRRRSVADFSRQPSSLRRLGLAREGGKATNSSGSLCLAHHRAHLGRGGPRPRPASSGGFRRPCSSQEARQSLLFKVDITRLGSVLESEVEEHAVEIDEENVATVKAASRDFILLQKAECFLLRRIMKVRDAFDVYRLRQVGVVLNEQLENHLHDTLMNHEIEAEDISRRTAQVDEKHCLNELRSLLPPTAFDALAREQFHPLRDALHELYRRWLED